SGDGSGSGPGMSAIRPGWRPMLSPAEGPDRYRPRRRHGARRPPSHAECSAVRGGQPGSARPHLLQAAGASAQMNGHEDHGARLLEALAMDPGLDATDCVWAATTLA